MSGKSPAVVRQDESRVHEFAGGPDMSRIVRIGAEHGIHFLP
jgi:hypothetical protein